MTITRWKINFQLGVLSMVLFCWFLFRSVSSVVSLHTWEFWHHSASNSVKIPQWSWITRPISSPSKSQDNRNVITCFTQLLGLLSVSKILESLVPNFIVCGFTEISVLWITGRNHLPAIYTSPNQQPLILSHITFFFFLNITQREQSRVWASY